MIPIIFARQDEGVYVSGPYALLPYGPMREYTLLIQVRHSASQARPWLGSLHIVPNTLVSEDRMTIWGERIHPQNECAAAAVHTGEVYVYLVRSHSVPAIVIVDGYEEPQVFDACTESAQHLFDAATFRSVMETTDHQGVAVWTMLSQL